MPVDLARLRDEFERDPARLGYARHVARGSDAQVADLLNAGAGTPPGSRAEALFGPGVVVTDADVARALRGDVTVDQAELDLAEVRRRNGRGLDQLRRDRGPAGSRHLEAL